MDNDRQRSSFREPKGLLGVVTKCFLCGIPIVGIFYILDIPLYFGQVFLYQQYLGLFLFLLLPTIFILKPATRKFSYDQVPWYDLILALAGLVIGGYVMIFYPDILNYLGFPSNERFILGLIAVFLILEGTRRLVGLSMVFIASFFILYAHFSYLFPGELWSRGYSWQRIFVYLYLQPDSLLGIPLHIAATMVLGFIFFGQALFVTGGGKFINDLSMVVMGRFRGGPAKVAVLASGMFGMMSGSAVSDVATTGVITIPMMKKIGYRPYVAAAIEAVASSGGAIMPPIMGAAAFVMSEFLNLPYSQIVTAAILPATLYYFSIFIQVDLYAAKSDFKGLSKQELPNTRETLKNGWTFILPIAVLVYCLFFLYLQPAVAGIYSAATVLLVSLIRKETRISWGNFVTLLENTGRNMLLLGIICGAAGFIIGMVSLTGLGFVFSSLLLKLAGENLYILLILTGLGSIVLGMGLPVTASYILLVILVAPAIVKMGVPALSAHLFILYFAILSFITPPVCLAVFTASGIADSKPMKTGFEGMRLGIIAYVVPFIFVINPALIMIGSLGDIIFSYICALMGTAFLAIALKGFLFRKLNVFLRGCFIVGAACLFIPGFWTSLVGVAIAVPLLAREWLAKRTAASQGIVKVVNMETKRPETT